MGKNKGKIWIIFLISLFFWLPPSIEANEQIFLLGETEESNITRTPLPLWATPSPIISISSGQIDQWDFTTLSELLFCTGDFYINKDPFKYELYSSGIKDGYLFMLDGIPFPYPSSPNPTPIDFQLPLSIFKKVTIMPGPFTSIWGFNAWGGVINLETVDGILHNKSRLTFSSRGYTMGSLMYGYNSPKLQSVTYVSFLNGSTEKYFAGYYPTLIKPGGELTSAGEILNRQYLRIEDPRDWYFTFFTKILTPRIRGELLITDFENRYGISTFSNMPLKNPGVRSNPSIFLKVDGRGKRKKTTTRYSLFLSRTMAHNTFPLYGVTTLTPTQALVTHTSDSLSAGIEVSALIKISPSLKLNTGLLENYTTKDNRVTGEDPFSGGTYTILSTSKEGWIHSLFTQISYLSDPYSILGGLRIHKQDQFPIIASPFISAAFRLNGTLLKLLYGISYRTPEGIDYTLLGIGLIKQQVDDIVTTVDRPEELETASLSLMRKYSKLDISTGLSWYREKTRIINTVTEGKFIIENTGGDNWWSFYVNADIMISRYLTLTSNAYYQTRDRKEIPSFILKNKLTLTYPILDIGVFLNYYGSTDINPSYTLANLVINVRNTGFLRETITLANLLNTRYYYRNNDGKIPGETRSIKFSVEYKW